MMRSRLDFTLDEADNLLLWEQEVFLMPAERSWGTHPTPPEESTL